MQLPRHEPVCSAVSGPFLSTPAASSGQQSWLNRFLFTSTGSPFPAPRPTAHVARRWSAAAAAAAGCWVRCVVGGEKWWREVAFGGAC